MDFYEEMLVEILGQNKFKLILNNLDWPLEEVIENKCYQALKEIKEILENDVLNDQECFAKIEAIISVFEGLGSGCGNRHDFG